MYTFITIVELIKKHIELLAPAKDSEGGIAAVNCGADAVYIGGPKYGARSAVSNAVRDISSLISYAHRYWAKVYIALNTILFDRELEEACVLARTLYEIGADALIIQDMGLLELGLPPIPVFASTQLNNDTPQKVRFLQEIGFQRVILARELSMQQLRDIRANTTVELECFIHGALCVGISGQCYLSQALFGRSSNRGECAQPCRMKYSLADGSGRFIARNKYLLSLKDLNLSSHISELIYAGISSLKIEGRLKDVNYVRNVTVHYRRIIDGILENDSSICRNSSGKTYASFEPDPHKTFNRGFTEYFINGRKSKLLSAGSPKSIGMYLGTVKETGSDFFLLDNSIGLHSGDGICFYDPKERLCGTNINRVAEGKIFPDKMKDISKGVKVFRNYDYSFVRKLESGSVKRRIDVRMFFRESENGFALTIEDKDGIKCTVETGAEKITASNPGTAEKSIEKQLRRTGNSIFLCKEIGIAWEKPYLVPLKICNKLRRDAANLLEKERVRLYPRRLSNIIPCETKNPEENLDYRSNISNSKAEAFYRRHGVQKLEKAFELQNETGGRVLMSMKHCLRFELGICGGRNESDAAPLYLYDKKNVYRLEFDCRNCMMKLMFEKKLSDR